MVVKLRLIVLVSACIGYRYVPIFGACLLRAIVGGVWLVCLIVGVGLCWCLVWFVLLLDGRFRFVLRSFTSLGLLCL